ncbi:MAG TPA: biotin/lipoyl-containing protein [Candidatus Limnocylindrales bacterium]|nr:biotin/lipoyl-containing protein [Candidatus Limnocylindrales bacterium]
MPEPQRPSDRTTAQREADHAGLARLSETLVPALVSKLNQSGLGELEVREGDWRIRLRRPTGSVPAARRERPRAAAHVPGHAPVRPGAATAAEPRDPHRAPALSPAVGVFRAIASVGTKVRSGDRIAVVDLLGIPQDVVAPIDGLLVEVLVETGHPVEYGEEVAIVAEPVDLAATAREREAEA